MIEPLAPSGIRLESIDTEEKARRRHPTRGGGGGPRPPTPGLRWTPLAYSILIGVCGASAALWVFLVGTTIGMFGDLVEKQSDLATRIAEITTRQCAGPVATADSDGLFRAEDPAGPAAQRRPRAAP